jgi:hypothetical protein
VKNEDEILFPFNHSMGHKKEEIFLRRWGLRKTNCCTFSLLHLLFPFFTFLFVFLLLLFLLFRCHGPILCVRYQGTILLITRSQFKYILRRT